MFPPCDVALYLLLNYFIGALGKVRSALVRLSARGVAERRQHGRESWQSPPIRLSKKKKRVLEIAHQERDRERMEEARGERRASEEEAVKRDSNGFALL